MVHSGLFIGKALRLAAHPDGTATSSLQQIFLVIQPDWLSFHSTRRQRHNRGENKENM